MATVRIYRVAELLGTTSQEVSALLKRDHGIDVKSASSTIEEVVARQFVERLARQRNISLPGGDMFAETPVVKGKKSTPAKRAPEPPKPTAPALPPPRLVKVAKAAPVAPPAPAEVEAPVEPPEVPAAVPPPAEVHPPAPVVAAAIHAPSPAATEVPAEPEAREVSEPPAEPTPAAAEPMARAAAGRVVPPTLRLRIEEQRPTIPTPPLPTAPAPRMAPRSAPKSTRAAGPTTVRPPAAGPAGATARPAAPPAPRPAGPMGARPPYPSPRPPMPMGGPRPLPSQPVRTQLPGAPPRPGQPYVQRPGGPSRPPYQHRPGGTGRPAAGQRREQARPAPPPMQNAPPPVTRTITLAEGMTVKDLADKLDIRVKDVLAKLLMKRLMMTINSALDTETATMIAREFGAEVQMRSFEEELQVDTEVTRPEDVVTRAPVVTVMGQDRKSVV